MVEKDKEKKEIQVNIKRDLLKVMIHLTMKGADSTSLI